MRRWNGWGEAAVTVPLAEAAKARIAQHVGAATPPIDATRDEVLAQLTESRAPSHPMLHDDASTRLRFARGQAFHDLVALRSGRLEASPDAVVFPECPADVRALLDYADRTGAALIPYGGGTSVVGGINAPRTDRPVVTVSLSRLSSMRGLDASDRLATFGAGITGPALEAHLRAQGYTLGHYPQSFEHSTLGGWIATRSRGQQSLGFGRIEELFAGGRLEAPEGSLVVAPSPSTSTANDLREMVLGSEGRLGFITEATVHVRPQPESERFDALLFRTWDDARAAMQLLAQDGPSLSMLRLSTPVETAMQLSLSSHARAISWAGAGLRTLGFGSDASMMVLGASGSAREVSRSLAAARDLCRGAIVLPTLGAAWARSRFKAPYLRDTLWSLGWGVETVETATTWSRLEPTRLAIESALTDALSAEDERVHAFSHLSHAYRSGSNVYTTFLFRLGATHDETLARWRRLKTAASNAIVQAGATISHQHGVGTDHKPWLEAEKGPLGVAAFRSLASTFDPAAVMNPGKVA